MSQLVAARVLVAYHPYVGSTVFGYERVEGHYKLACSLVWEFQSWVQSKEASPSRTSSNSANKHTSPE